MIFISVKITYAAGSFTLWKKFKKELTFFYNKDIIWLQEEKGPAIILGKERYIRDERL